MVNVVISAEGSKRLVYEHTIRSVLTIGTHQQDELPRVALTAGLDEHDHLIMCVLCNISTVDQNNLIALIQSRHTQISLERRHRKKMMKFKVLAIR